MTKSDSIQVFYASPYKCVPGAVNALFANSQKTLNELAIQGLIPSAQIVYLDNGPAVGQVRR